jgi:hypothetical protein
MNNTIISIATVIVVFFMVRFFYKLIVGLRKGMGVFLPGFSKKRKSIYFSSKVQEEAFLRRTDAEKKKIIRESLLKQGYTLEQIKEIEKKNLEIAEGLIDKVEKNWEKSKITKI